MLRPLAFLPLTALVAASLLPTGAAAQSNQSQQQGNPKRTQQFSQRMQDRFQNQKQRLKKGVKSGNLTHSEYNHDVNQLRNARQTYRQDMKSGNGFTSKERQQVRSQLRHSGQSLYYTKHNTKRQPGS